MISSVFTLSLIGRRASVGFWRRLALMREARRQRRALLALPPERLRDIGVSAAEARREATRPAWNVPAHWLR